MEVNMDIERKIRKLVEFINDKEILKVMRLLV